MMQKISKFFLSAIIIFNFYTSCAAQANVAEIKEGISEFFSLPKNRPHRKFAAIISCVAVVEAIGAYFLISRLTLNTPSTIPPLSSGGTSFPIIQVIGEYESDNTSSQKNSFQKLLPVTIIMAAGFALLAKGYLDWKKNSKKAKEKSPK
jgi:uncharacterized membrane protein YidH (DUF202 family)